MAITALFRTQHEQCKTTVSAMRARGRVAAECCLWVSQTVFRVGLALLKTVEGELLRVDFEKLLGTLNAKWFPAFARPPDELLRVALRFKVSGRLARYRMRH